VSRPARPAPARVDTWVDPYTTMSSCRGGLMCPPDHDITLT